MQRCRWWYGACAPHEAQLTIRGAVEHGIRALAHACQCRPVTPQVHSCEPHVGCQQLQPPVQAIRIRLKLCAAAARRAAAPSAWGACSCTRCAPGGGRGAAAGSGGGRGGSEAAEAAVAAAAAGACSCRALCHERGWRWRVQVHQHQAAGTAGCQQPLSQPARSVQRGRFSWSEPPLPGACARQGSSPQPHKPAAARYDVAAAPASVRWHPAQRGSDGSLDLRGRPLKTTPPVASARALAPLASMRAMESKGVCWRERG